MEKEHYASPDIQEKLEKLAEERDELERYWKNLFEDFSKKSLTSYSFGIVYRAWLSRKQRLDECLELQVSGHLKKQCHVITICRSLFLHSSLILWKYLY